MGRYTGVYSIVPRLTYCLGVIIGGTNPGKYLSKLASCLSDYSREGLELRSTLANERAYVSPKGEKPEEGGATGIGLLIYRPPRVGPSALGCGGGTGCIGVRELLWIGGGASKASCIALPG
mmetsp:Transcript_30759/g.5555  ORF Transcript_30759/g.5555 Transcript_30759/m.5555 type:complete len:121 (+) Transcript_30759:688-1050(+)